MGVRGWSRLALVPWAVYAVGFGVWAAIAFSRGLIPAGLVAVVCVGIGIVMTVRTFRQHRRFMREHEARLAEIRAEALRRVEEIEARVAQQRREAVLRLAEELRRNAPHN